MRGALCGAGQLYWSLELGLSHKKNDHKRHDNLENISSYVLPLIVRAVGRSENPGVQEEGVSKISRLINGRFTTISSHFFGDLHYIFHKTEIPTVILRLEMIVKRPFVSLLIFETPSIVWWA